MFTGIIETIGKVTHVSKKDISQIIGIRIDDFNSSLGDSICCLLYTSDAADE